MVDGSIVDSAAVGSTVPKVDSLSIRNAGGGDLHWTARTVHASPWLSLQPDSGVAGSAMVVKADPTGLPLGNYQDTLIVTSTIGGAVLVPVLFRID